MMTQCHRKNYRVFFFCLLLVSLIVVCYWLYAGHSTGEQGASEAPLEGLCREYHLQEGHAGRAGIFELLALSLAEKLYNGETIQCEDSLRLLGPPDGIIAPSAGTGPNLWVYLYNKTGMKDGVVFCEIEPGNVRVTLIGFNDLRVLKNVQILPFVMPHPVEAVATYPTVKDEEEFERRKE